MEFDFAALSRRITERFGSHKAFANALGLPAEKLNRILSGQASFTFSEIIKTSELLEIEGEKIVTYFFTPKVR